MKKRMNLRVLSFILAMITVFISTSFTAIAEETTVNQPEPVTSSPTSDETTSSGTSEALSWTAEPVYHYAVNEIPDLREENVKHFYMPDGTYKAVVYADSIHRQDATGAWKDIDNSLSIKSVSGTNKYSTSDGRVTFAPVFTHNSNVMTLTENGYTVSMAMTGTLPDHISTQNVPLTMTDAGVNRNEQLGWHSIDDAANIDTSSSVKYTNVAEKTDLEYILTGNDIKENIIIKAPQSGYEYTFILTLSGLTAMLENDGSVTLSDAETGDAVYFIPAPYMYDAAGNTSHSVSYSLLTIKDEIYALTVTADSEWINAEGRAFPVTVDPTVNSSTACRDTYISSSNPTANYCSAEYLLLTSEDNIGLIRHVSPGFPKDAIIRKVELNVYYYFPTSTYGEVELWFSPILQSWNPLTITWSSANLSTLLDRFYHVIDLEVSETATCSSPALATFDVTTIYERWLEEESSTYYGIAIEQQFTDKDLRIKSYESAAQYRPYYVYTYTDIIQDGVYSLQNMASMTYTTIGDMSTFEGSSVEQVSLTGNPVNTFNRQGLFKITGIEGTDRFVIRSMINNKHTISMTSDGMVTKEIPAYDSDVALEDTYYIEYGMDGVEFRPAGTPTYALSVNSSTLDISTVPEASIGMGESWVITKYSGSANGDANYYMNTDHLMVETSTVLTPYSWSTVPGANYVSMAVDTQYESMADWGWSVLDKLYLYPYSSGNIVFRLRIANGSSLAHTIYRTASIDPLPIEEGIYHIKQGNIYMALDMYSSDLSIHAITSVGTYDNDIAFGDCIWYFEHLNSGYYKISSLSMRSSDRKDNMVITNCGGSVFLDDYVSSDDQKWLIEKSENSCYIKSKSDEALYLSCNSELLECSLTPTLLQLEESELPVCYWSGSYNSGIINNELHIKIIIDDSVLTGGITEDMFDVVEYWEDVCDKIHIYMPGENTPSNVYEVKFVGIPTSEDYAAITYGVINDVAALWYNDMDCDSAEIRLNTISNGELLTLYKDTNVEWWAIGVRKTILHEMGHALKLSHLKDEGEDGYFNQTTVLSVMNQGHPLRNPFVLVYPGLHDVYSLKQKWGWN